MMKKLFSLGLLVLGVMTLSPFPDSLWAANEVQDAYTGTNLKREHTETGSLFNTLRGVYRPDYNKPAAPPSQAPYKRIAPPKWTYYGSKPKVEAQEKRSQQKRSAIDGRYYKTPIEASEAETSRKPSRPTPHNP